MITEIKHYYCNNTPSDMDILEGMNIAKEKQCRVTIHWFKWGWEYTVTIDETSSLDEVKEQIPKVYGM